MKVRCPICGIEGFLEIRGSSRRVVHYRGIVDGKRVYEKHRIDSRFDSQMGIKNMGIKTHDLTSFSQIDVDGAGFEPASSAMPTLRSYQTDLPAHTLRNLPL